MNEKYKKNKTLNIINIKKFDPNLFSIDKISFKIADCVIYNTRYTTMKSLDSENIDRENPLCIIFDNVDGYIIEESNRHKYLLFASTKDNKKIFSKYTKVWDEIKNQFETINGAKPVENKTFYSDDDDLPLGRILSIPMCLIVVRSVLQYDSKCYPQVFIHKCT